MEQQRVNLQDRLLSTELQGITEYWMYGTDYWLLNWQDRLLSAELQGITEYWMYGTDYWLLNIRDRLLITELAGQITEYWTYKRITEYWTCWTIPSTKLLSTKLIGMLNQRSV